MQTRFRLGEEAYTVSAVNAAGNAWTITIDGKAIQAKLIAQDGPCFTFRLDNGQIIRSGVQWKQTHGTISVNGNTTTISEERASDSAAGAGGGSGLIQAPLPGRIVDIQVTTGDTVTPGQTLCIIEAMKMQNEICAPSAGVVSAIHTSIDATVESGDQLIHLDKE